MSIITDAEREPRSELHGQSICQWIVTLNDSYVRYRQELDTALKFGPWSDKSDSRHALGGWVSGRIVRFPPHLGGQAFRDWLDRVHGTIVSKLDDARRQDDIDAAMSLEENARAGLAKAVIENELLNWLSSELSQVAKWATPEALN